MADTVIWITGATEGIGLGLARNCPYPDARIINLSRRQHPDYETVRFNLTDPQSWNTAIDQVTSTLRDFSGKRAIFIQNAYYSQGVGLLSKVPADRYRDSVIANCAAPLVLGQAFVAACPPGIEAGLVMLSSGAAASPLEGLASYCAAKTAIEHWSEVAQREMESAGRGPWVVAVRPGGVDTAPVREIANWDPELYPRAREVKDNIVNRIDIDGAAQRIWKELPPAPGTAVISFSAPPGNPRFAFGGERVKIIDDGKWKLVYATDEPTG